MDQIVPVDEADDVEQAEYSRMRCDPSIGVSDLEKAIDGFMTLVGYRNVQEVLDMITESKATWKSAPKARADSYMSLSL